MLAVHIYIYIYIYIYMYCKHQASIYIYICTASIKQAKWDCIYSQIYIYIYIYISDCIGGNNGNEANEGNISNRVCAMQDMVMHAYQGLSIANHNSHHVLSPFR